MGETERHHMFRVGFPVSVFYPSCCVVYYYYLVGVVEEVNRDAERQ